MFCLILDSLGESVIKLDRKRPCMAVCKKCTVITLHKFTALMKQDNHELKA